MAEVVLKLGLPPLEGFLYFVERDCTVWKHQGSAKECVFQIHRSRQSITSTWGTGRMNFPLNPRDRSLGIKKSAMFQERTKA